MGGEQFALPRKARPDFGSSPHGRGTVFLRSVQRLLPRFIPAWAGNSISQYRKAPERTVHPRMGGEQRIKLPDPDRDTGSSPHGRGTVDEDAVVKGNARFIPAWAGNS